MRTIEHRFRVGPTIRLAIVTLTVCWGQAALSKSATSTVAVPQNVSAKPARTAAEYIGEARCIECHGQENKHFSETLHAKVFRLNPKNDRQRQGCEACHGPGSNHARNAYDKTALVGFTKRWGTPVDVQNGQCLTCHEGGTRLHWPGSTHAKSNLGCADCHNPMQKVSANSLLARQSISETCFQCHKQQRAEFRKRSHMPLPEGKMSCVDCHNPHGSATRALLNADSVNESATPATPKSGGRSSGSTRPSARVASTVTSLMAPTTTSCSWARVPTSVSSATTCRWVIAARSTARADGCRCAAGGRTESTRDRAHLPELPLADPWQQSSGWRTLPALTRTQGPGQRCGRTLMKIRSYASVITLGGVLRLTAPWRMPVPAAGRRSRPGTP